MVTNFIFSWFLSMWIGFLLLPIRSDWSKIKLDVNFAFNKGTLYHKITIILSSFIILPISIFYSIKNILNK
jgi:hypothetical protein